MSHITKKAIEWLTENEGSIRPEIAKAYNVIKALLKESARYKEALESKIKKDRGDDNA